MKKIIGLLALAVWTGTASAALIELGPESSGEIGTGGGLAAGTASHITPLTSIRGWQAAQFSEFSFDSYMIFDTSSMDFTAQSATLFLNVNDTLSQFAGPGALELWGLDTYTPADLLALPTGDPLDTQIDLAIAIASDLRSGTSLATSVLGPDGVVGIELNGAALGQINAANGLWGFGLSDSRFGALLGGLDLVSPPRLLLSGEPTSPPSPVPIPATTWLIGSALLGLGVARRKKV